MQEGGCPTKLGLNIAMEILVGAMLITEEPHLHPSLD
jgi:hypothetical protein